MVFIGVRWCCGRRLGARGPHDWLAGQVFSLHRLSHIGYSSYRLTLTRGENGFWKFANTWLAGEGDVADRPYLGSVEPVLYATTFPHVILSVTMPYFGHNEGMHRFCPYGAFPSSDVPEIVDQQNSLVTVTYLLYLE
jgi:hypothetical protein